jgi:penicillin-binding protein 1A
MKLALADKPAVPFRVPPGIKLIRIDPKTGTRIAAGSPGGLLEAFKPGTAPPDSYSVVGYQQDGGDYGAPRPPVGVSPEADRAVGRGGLY